MCQIKIEVPIPTYNKVVKEIIADNIAYTVKLVSESAIKNYYTVEAVEPAMTELYQTIGTKIYMLDQVKETLEDSFNEKLKNEGNNTTK